MLEKIVNSMLYGNLKTKVFLWSVLLMAVSAVALIMTAVVLGLPMLGLGGAGIGILGFFVSQSVSLNDLNRSKKKKDRPVGERDVKHTDEKKAKEMQDIEEGEAGRRRREKEKAQYLASMDAKKVKKLMKEHKVNQIHVKVMIDSYPAKKIEQAPAFMWKTDTKLHFMVLTGQAEEFEVPLEDIKGILLVKDVPANPERDYMPFKYSSYIAKMFQPFLPEYFESTKEGTLQIKKNTFRIEPGIYLTNSSVGNLRRVLLPGVAFLVDDNVIASRKFNEYFKEIYRQSILCKNLVITLDEYKESVGKNLDALLEAPISGTEFVNTIYDLNKYRLITKDFVVKYTQLYRERNMNK